MIFQTFSLCFLVHLSLTNAASIAPAVRSNTGVMVFYPGLGQFYARPGSKILPEDPQKVNTQFFLYTRESLGAPGELISRDNLGSYNPSKPTTLITHGFTDKASNKWVINMKEELLKAEDANVIAVDWSGGNQWPYPQAVANTPLVAAVIRQVLQEMIKRGAKPQQMHLIGHSLGAHISGYVGQHLPDLGRISGLDPAGPDFYIDQTLDRLDPSDALFVDVIHTDGANQVQNGFGHKDPLGHVDFYPNGGSIQPSCGKDTAEVLFQTVGSLVTTWNIDNALDRFACKHMSAVYYFISSINAEKSAFGYPCSNYSTFDQGQCATCGSDLVQCQPLGYHAAPDRQLGVLYLNTIDGVKAPHFGSHLKLVIKSDDNNDPGTRASVSVKLASNQEVFVCEPETHLTPGIEKSRTVVFAKNPLPLDEISVSFQRSFNLQLNWGLSDQWRIRSVTIFDMQSNQSYEYCPTSPVKIKSGSRLTYRVC